MVDKHANMGGRRHLQSQQPQSEYAILQNLYHREYIAPRLQHFEEQVLSRLMPQIQKHLLENMDDDEIMPLAYQIRAFNHDTENHIYTYWIHEVIYRTSWDVRGFFIHDDSGWEWYVEYDVKRRQD